VNIVVLNYISDRSPDSLLFELRLGHGHFRSLPHLFNIHIRFVAHVGPHGLSSHWRVISHIDLRAGVILAIRKSPANT